MMSVAFDPGLKFIRPRKYSYDVQKSCDSAGCRTISRHGVAFDDVTGFGANRSVNGTDSTYFCSDVSSVALDNSGSKAVRQ